MSGEHAERTVLELLGILFPTRPRRALDRMFAEGRVRSGGRPVSPRRRVGDLGDLEVVGGLSDLPETSLGTADSGVEVLHEDERLWVLAKPAGVSVVPDRASGRESCLAVLLRRELESRAGKGVDAYARPRIVHRIDRLTSGLTIAARTPEAERELGRYFEAANVRKEYVALVSGRVAPARVAVDCPIGEGRKGRMRIAPAGRSALTELDVIERLSEATLLLARPRTGRTHQIRVHCAALGHPIVGDPLYGRRHRTASDRAAPGRLALHAWRYTLPESWPGERAFTCPIPSDLREMIDRVRRGETEGE